MAGALGVVMRVRGRDLSLQRPAIAEHAKSFQRVGREAHRHRRLGEGDRLLRIIGNIDAAIVGELGIEDRGDAPEQRAAGIGGELGIGNLTGLGGGPKRVALEKAIGIAHASSGKGEAVEHGEPVEPMIVGARAHLELRGPGTEQGAGEPGGQRAGDAAGRPARVFRTSASGSLRHRAKRVCRASRPRQNQREELRPRSLRQAQAGRPNRAVPRRRPASRGTTGRWGSRLPRWPESRSAAGRHGRRGR